MSWRRTIKRGPMWVALVLVVVGLLAVGASRSSGPRTADERLEYVSTRLACPICQGESVFESRNSDSEAIRTEIRSQIGQGQLSDDQIITYMTDRYGAQLLLVPKASGFDALVWALPAAALVCAIVGLGFAFHRWRRAVDTVPDDDDRALVASARAAADGAAREPVEVEPVEPEPASEPEPVVSRADREDPGQGATRTAEAAVEAEPEEPRDEGDAA